MLNDDNLTLGLKESFIDDLKNLKCDSLTAKNLMNELLIAHHTEFEDFIDSWKNNFELFGFNLNSYIEKMKFRINSISYEEIVTYNIYYFILSLGLTQIIIKEAGIKNHTDWLKKQIFSPFLFKIYETNSILINDLLTNFAYAQKLVGTIDILKILYEAIFPPKIRKTLGEFYTPDWLVGMILDKVDHIGISIVDPSCGSGTFLIRSLRLKLKSVQNRPQKLLEVLDSVIGFDINFISVQVARLNLLLVLSTNLTEEINPIVMPIYLVDSIYNPFLESTTKRLDSDFENNDENDITMNRNGKIINIPNIAVDTDNYSFNDYSDLRKKLTQLNNLEPDSILDEFIIGNIIAYKRTKRDLVLGNPPWLAWDEINDGYRKLLSEQWKFLFTQRGWRAKVAAGRVDLSAIFVYSSQINFSKVNSKMVFVLPSSLFKSKSAAEGFRNFRSEKGVFRPDFVWDFTNLSIFPNASNKAIVTFFTKGKSIETPIQWLDYSSKLGKKISPMVNSEEFTKEAIVREKISFPISKTQKNTPWVSIFEKDKKIIEKLEGKSVYKARGGINTGGANTIFWVKLLDQEEGLITIQNVGKSLRAKSKKIKDKVEPKFVHPLIRGRNVERWKYSHDLGIIVPYDPEIDSKKAIPEEQLSIGSPLVYQFLSKFKTELRNRKEYKRWGGRGPFYELYRIGPYTFAPFKVIWAHTGIKDEMRCCVLTHKSERALMDQKVILIQFSDEIEAHYVCALLNSEIVYDFLSSYLILDASTHIMNHLNIPKFDPLNVIHMKLARFSMKCHRHAKEDKGTKKFETEIDYLARKLWDLVD
ncbi:MAG: Eco57I restriction-modification methylase domain-containing protein [Candidatus Hodarchaeales archaeon]